MVCLATIQTGLGINGVRRARPNCMGSGSEQFMVSRPGSGLLTSGLFGVVEGEWRVIPFSKSLLMELRVGSPLE